MDRETRWTIGILGGTGPEGRGLALRWAARGHAVVVGSRDAVRARSVAADLSARLTEVPAAAAPTGADNVTAAREADVAVLAVPYAAQAATLAEVRQALAGKVLVSVVVPLRPPAVDVVHVPKAGSAALEARAALGDAAPVAIAFQNVAAGKLDDPESDIGADVLVCADDPRAKSVALALVAAAGAVGYDAGPLANAGVVEGLTAVLIGLNRRYGGTGAGVRITDLSLPAPTDG